LPPPLHGLGAFVLAVLGAIAGMMVFTLLCTPQGFDLRAGNPVLNFVGGALLFFATVPTAAIGSVALWQRYVPARCGRCGRGVQFRFVGKQLVYPCTMCGRL